MVTADERASIAEARDRLTDDAVSFLQEMIRTPSINPPGDYQAIADVLSDQFEDFGWEAETVRTPDSVLAELGLDPSYPRLNVLGYVARGEGPTIALNAHLDTVPVDESESWDHDPFGGEIDDGRVYGRGAMDSKGRIASYSLAGRILDRSGLLPEDATIVVAITCDEETGGAAGAGYVTESGSLRPDYAIVEGAVDRIWRAASGILRPRVTVTGKASHAGVDPDSGANAVVGAARIVNALDKHATNLAGRSSEIPDVDHPTCTPATIEGGIKANVIPPECSFLTDMRVPPEANLDAAEAEFRDVVDGVTLPAGASASVDITQRSQPYIFEEDAVHVQALKENAEAVRGESVPVVGTRGSTDARYFAPAGAKCVNYGPGDGRSNPHGADENVAIDQVADVGAIIAGTILDVTRGA